jgi:hypothetical protein
MTDNAQVTVKDHPIQSKIHEVRETRGLVFR